MKNRITERFLNRDKKVLSVFTTAGFPEFDSLIPLCETLEDSGVEMIEIGFPFSDPLADGPTIQKSSEAALANGMTLVKLFEQLASFRVSVKVPALLMGYLNPVVQFGVENFFRKAADCGIDGVILPDLPFQEYLSEYKALAEELNLSVVFLITPQTPEERIREIDEHSHGFIYAVSVASVTGKALEVDSAREEYFRRLSEMKLKNPVVVGFGISDRESFEASTKYLDGGIIGSAFIRAIENCSSVGDASREFVSKIKSS